MLQGLPHSSTTEQFAAELLARLPQSSGSKDASRKVPNRVAGLACVNVCSLQLIVSMLNKNRPAALSSEMHSMIWLKMSKRLSRRQKLMLKQNVVESKDGNGG